MQKTMTLLFVVLAAAFVGSFSGTVLAGGYEGIVRELSVALSVVPAFFKLPEVPILDRDVRYLGGLEEGELPCSSDTEEEYFCSEHEV